MTGPTSAGEPTPGFAGGAAVAIQGVSVSFGSGTPALRGVDVVVQPGEAVAIVGPSGAGKSTLLGLCTGLVTPTTGSVLVLGNDLGTLSDRALQELRGDIGTIHQHLSLVGQLQVVHNVDAGNLGRWSRRHALWSLLRPHLDQARRALDRVGIADKVRDRTDTLSGGEQQRVAIARVLVQDPRLVVADEPIASLDPTRGREVLTLLTKLAREDSRTLLVSLHAFDLARELCDRVVGLRSGELAFDLPATEVSDGLGASLYRTGVDP